MRRAALDGLTSRRSILASGVGCAALWSTGAFARPAPKEAAVAAVPLLFAIAEQRVGQKVTPVVSAAFIQEQLAQANAIFGEHDLQFDASPDERTIEARFAALENRADRDALADLLLPRAVNVFFVSSLRDVDDPSLHRMGVTWRKLSNLKKRYVIVAASARETTMAHELGHFLGLDHTYVTDNLMSYERDGGKVFLDDGQGKRVRTRARELFARGELAAREDKP